MPDTSLARSIFKTVAYFNAFNYPLTAFEIWEYLYEPDRAYSLGEVVMELENCDFLKNNLIGKNGFYAVRAWQNADFEFAARALENMIKSRHNNYLDAERKMRKLRTATRYLKLIPTIRAVAACNNLAWRNTNAQSDIDIFIIAAPKTLWITRFLTVLPFALLKMRPASRAKDPFCFSFFVSERDFDLSCVALNGGDSYLVYWVASLVPMFDRGGVFDEFFSANEWVYKILPNARRSEKSCAAPNSEKSWAAPRSVFVNALSKTLAPIEKMLGKIQMRKLRAQIAETKNANGSGVIINESMLKFHFNDGRELYREKFHKLCEKYL